MDMLVVLAHTKVEILLCRVSDQHIVCLKLTVLYGHLSQKNK